MYQSKPILSLSTQAFSVLAFAGSMSDQGNQAGVAHSITMGQNISHIATSALHAERRSIT